MLPKNIHHAMQSVRSPITRLVLVCLLCLVNKKEAGNVDKGLILQRTTFPSSNRSQEYRAVTEFRSQMLYVISMFPVIRQCTTLTAILEKSGEKISPIIGDLVSKPHQHLPCLRGVSKPESAVNTSALRWATNVYVTKVFNRLPLAYKCLVLARTLHEKGPGPVRQTEGFLKKTMATLTKELPLLDTTGRCMSGKSRRITKAYVRLGIRLRKLMSFKVWLKKFKNKLPALYLRHITKSGKISEVINGWKREENGDAVAVIPRDKFVVQVKDAPVSHDNVIIMTFSFLSREISGDYTTVDGKDVVAAFKAMGRSQLNNVLQAEVIGSSAFSGEKSERRHPHRKGKLSDTDIARLLAFFPRYLKKLFKSLPGAARCYVLRQISSHLGQDMLLVEKSYHSLGSLQKKHFCSRVTKQEDTKSPHLASVWDRVDELCRIIPGREVSVGSPNTTALTENARIVRETRPFNSMELVLFALLGFLCLLILVFLANCVVFTFKTKQLSSKCDKDVSNPTSQTCDEKCKIVENDNEIAVKISDSQQFRAEDPKYSILLVTPLSVKDDTQENIVVDWKSGVHHSTRIWRETKEGVTLCEVKSLGE